MTEVRPRILLPTPPRADPAEVAARLPAALATGLVTCVRLDLPGASEDEVRRAADLLRTACHAGDTALVIAEHFRLVRLLGLDGVQVGVRTANLRKVREAIGKDAILGVACGATRHDGITAAEAGADYVLFGPLEGSTGLGEGEGAADDLFEWWSEIVEAPVVAEGGVDEAAARRLGPFVDFAAPDASIWDEPDLADALRRFAAALESGSEAPAD